MVPLAVLLAEPAAKEVVDGQLDGLFRRDANELRQEPAVEPNGALVSGYLHGAVDGIFVQGLDTLHDALVLHPCLGQIDRVHEGRTNPAGDRAEHEVLGKINDAFEERLFDTHTLGSNVTL